MLNDSTQYIEGQLIRHILIASVETVQSKLLQALKNQKKIFFSFFRFLMIFTLSLYQF